MKNRGKIKGNNGSQVSNKCTGALVYVLWERIAYCMLHLVIVACTSTI